MTHQTVIIVDDQTTSHQTIETTLNDAQLTGIFVDNTTDAWQLIEEEDVSLVLLRGVGRELESEELCRKIRTRKTAEQCSVIVILTEDDLAEAAGFLIAGANDLLVEPFEPRELRMRAVIVPADQVRRIDQAHVVNQGKGPKLIVPEFNPQTLQMDFGFRQHEVAAWEANPDVRKIALDTICACPECESIASFRPGLRIMWFGILRKDRLDSPLCLCSCRAGKRIPTTRCIQLVVSQMPNERLSGWSRF